MAQLLLTAASGVGTAVSNAGIGAFLARTAATTAASYAAGYADRLIFGPRKRAVDGPRLDSFSVQAAQEGAPVLRIYGRARMSGQLIWAANFKENTAETTEAVGGKGSRPAAQTTYTEYLYSISFAIGLCEGEIDRIGRVWADGKPLDLSSLNIRVYRGTENQNPDPLIEAVEDVAPTFRGLAYIVFEDMPLKEFGNRIPQLSFEVEKSLKKTDPDALENRLSAVCLIPGSGEFVYGTTGVTRVLGEGVTASENIHNNQGVTDFTASIDALLDAAPNLDHVSIVVSWFGNTIDAGSCDLRPGVETRTKETTPYDWDVGGVDRDGAHLISSLDGGSAYGGTPADRNVIETIKALKNRGIKVMFHPFILMDAAGFPWRGRIAGDDQTAMAGSDIENFFGAASPSDFSTSGEAVSYSGPSEWSFRRMILHYGRLCALAGGVDSFLLGSELRGLTTTRDHMGAYPAVAQLKSLAADVRSILGAGTKLSYGADWSEYFGHHPGGGAVHFHLDEFWSDTNVDFIGIDNYMPLADWRDGFGHLDAEAGYTGQYDRNYLAANIAGGEGYEYYYVNTADREAQARTPITDSDYDEPWVWRYKDLRNWWSNYHYDRPNGNRSETPTTWQPQSKPIYFTEIGCPAVDKGANQPNVFVDAKSSESALPYFSDGRRDDLAQRSLIEAHGNFWRDAANNPVSSVYGSSMVDADRQYVYTWDARPFPDFPARSDIWGDTANWEKGHWLNGRLGRAPLGLLVSALSAEAGADNLVTYKLDGTVTGYVIDRPMSAREMIDPLADVYQFDMIEVGDEIRCQPRHGAPVISLSAGDLLARKEGPFSHHFTQEADLPSAFRLGFFDEQDDFGTAVAEARDPGARPVREAGVDIAAVIPAAEAEARARSILADAWVMRETLEFTLPPSLIGIEPGDSVYLNDLGTDRQYRILQIDDADGRECSLVRVSPDVYNAPVGAAVFTPPPSVPVFSAPIWELMDLPLLGDDIAPRFAAFSDPWPGGAALYRSAGGAPVLAGRAPARAMMGRLATPSLPAPSGRWSGASVGLRLFYGNLASHMADDVFSGANTLAVMADNGAWEVLQFRDAELLEDGTWWLSNLLRGQVGTEREAKIGAATNARAVLLSPAVSPIEFSNDLRGIEFEWQAGPESEIPDTDNFTTRLFAPNLRALMPLSPVHLRAKRVGSDIKLSWIRRTRVGGDSWQGEVPLGETFERYRLTVFDGETALKTVEVAQPEYLYDSADIAADFGITPPDDIISISVVQLSDAVGDGIAAHRELSIE